MFRKSIVVCFAAALLAATVSPVSAGLFGKRDCCDPCCEPAPVCCEPVCCKPCPPPVKKTLSLCDPCGCKQCVDLCIPACCADEEPCITCRDGLFGRRIYTITWKCCGHRAKVVMTSHGDVRVR